MKVQSIQNNQTTFKSGYPVIHWVRETKGGYAPVVTEELNKSLQRKLVRMLNSDIKDAKPADVPLISKLKSVVLQNDKDYVNNSVVRSYYNSEGNLDGDRIEPFGYILTGQHCEQMSNRFGKPIGRAKSEAPRIDGELKVTAETKLAVFNYVKVGLNYVKRLASNFNKKNPLSSELHTKFVVERTKTGRIKNIKFEDAKFCPSAGPNNPFERMGYTKNK